MKSLNGMIWRDAVKVVDVMAHTVRKWIHLLNKSGLVGLKWDQPSQREPSDIGIEKGVSAAELRRAFEGFDQRFARRLEHILYFGDAAPRHPSKLDKRFSPVGNKSALIAVLMTPTIRG